MSVFVDDACIPFGRMIMCHMIASETQELLNMATDIDLDHKWIQKPGTYKEHFDVSLGYKAKAIAQGAIEIDIRTLVEILHGKRSADRGNEAGGMTAG